jgi:DNA-binding GntR family transcriptional regulator
MEVNNMIINDSQKYKINKESLKTQAYNYLKNSLLDEVFERGKIYSEQYFADLMGISRTPVREAVLQLSNEGLFKIHRNIGVSIQEISSNEMEDLFQLREAIESYCCKIASSSQDKAGLDDLIVNLESMTIELEELLHNKCSPAEFMHHDTGFHLTIVSYTGNKKFIEIMEQIRFRINLVGIKTIIPGRLERVIVEHTRIINNIAVQNPVGSVEALEDHFKKVKDIYIYKSKCNE